MSIEIEGEASLGIFAYLTGGYEKSISYTDGADFHYGDILYLGVGVGAELPIDTHFQVSFSEVYFSEAEILIRTLFGSSFGKLFKELKERWE